MQAGGRGGAGAGDEAGREADLRLRPRPRGLRETEAAGEAPERPAEFVEALAKGLAILENFDAAHPAMTLSEVAQRARLSPAAARRSLMTLEALGYVGRDGRRFHLRPRVMTLGSAFVFSARIDELLQPEIRAFVDLHGDASSVATLVGHDVLYVAHHSVQRARRPTANIGARYPAHATSLGRVLLASKSDAALDAWLETLTPSALTSRTVVDKAELRSLVLRAREDGYATTVDQLDYGITALAVPIRDTRGRVRAALNTSGYSGDVTEPSLVETRLRDLRASAGRIAQTLARYPILASMIDDQS